MHFNMNKLICILTLSILSGFSTAWGQSAIRLDGIYQAEGDHGYHQYLRFYDDGLVIYQYALWSPENISRRTLNYNAKDLKANGFYVEKEDTLHIPLYSPFDKKVFFFTGRIKSGKTIEGRFYDRKDDHVKEYPLKVFKFIRD